MKLLTNFIDFVIHLDKYLSLIISQFGAWTYIILFLIIFAETGLVVTPFLPGDSLLFAAGAFAAVDSLNIIALLIVFLAAAILGDTINYSAGKFFGSRAFKKYPKIFKEKYLIKTRDFYDKYGAKTVLLSRFVPIVRTFAPFIAGVGRMDYFKFLLYNVFGAVLWVALFVFGGYFFGNIQWVKDNFSLVILIIIVLSFMPMAWEFYRHMKNKKHQNKNHKTL